MSQLRDAQSPLNPMKKPRIEKVVLNLSVGESGENLRKAMTVLEQLTGQKPSQRKAKRTIREWGIHRNEPISCLATLRRERARSLLKRAFNAVNNQLYKRSIDLNGNFAFGIEKHIDLPGVRYNPELGIFGMDVCVAMEKPGYRVKRRRQDSSKVGKGQRVTRIEVVEYLKEEFGVDVLED